MSTFVNEIDEHRVNSTTQSSQAAPSVARLTDGYVVVWQSLQTPTGYADPRSPAGYEIYMQRYAQDGSALGGETHVNTVAINDQRQPVVAALEDGGFVIAWASTREHAVVNFDSGIYLQRFDASGNALGTETQVNSFYFLNQERPAIAALANGAGFVVTWWSDTQSPSPPGVYARRFDTAGNALGDESRVGAATAGSQSDPVTTGLANGGYVIVWDASTGVYAQRFNNDGTPQGTELRVNTGIAGGQAQPAVSALADGGFAIAWQAAGQDGDGLGVHLQRFDADGNPSGAQTQVNTTSSGNQTAPSVTPLGDGGFAVAWTSTGQDGGGEGVYSQRYEAGGEPVGSETRVNTTTAGDQSNPSIAATGDGGFIAAWMSFQQDGSDWGVYAAIVANTPPLQRNVDGIDTAIVGASTASVLAYSVNGDDVSITTAQGTQNFVDVERVRFSDALFALDTQAPAMNSAGGHVWQAAALLWAGFGVAPGQSELSQWTAQADRSTGMGDLAQAMIDFHAPGVASTDLVVHLYQTLFHQSPQGETVQDIVDRIGAGKQFETQGELLAYAAGLPVNTDRMIDLVGAVQALDLAWFAA